MNKKEWYKERILWKVSQFKSLSQVELKDEEKHIFLRELCEGYLNFNDEILLLFSSKNKKEWTIVTADKIISHHDNHIFHIELDNIEKLIDIRQDGISDSELKHHANFLLVSKDQIPIWVPDSKILFALMNILRMFPLKDNK